MELLHTHHTRINRKSKDNLLCLPRVCFGAQRGAAAFSIRNRGGNHSSSNSSSSDCPGPLSLFLSPFLFPPIASHPPREPIFIDKPPEGNKHTDCPLSLSLFCYFCLLEMSICACKRSKRHIGKRKCRFGLYVRKIIGSAVTAVRDGY